MEIEQIKPNKPNFGLIVALFCGTLLLVLVLALVFLQVDGKHINFRHHTPNPNARLRSDTPPFPADPLCPILSAS